MASTINASTSAGLVSTADTSGVLQLQTANTTVLNAELGKALALQGATSTTGCGIAFPATQSASTDPNTLDDYEEGTWTPSLGGTATYNKQVGRYVKVGQIVYITCTVHVLLIGTGAANLINGLPFPVLYPSPAVSGSGLSIASFSGLAGGNIYSLYAVPTFTTTYITFSALTAASASISVYSPFGNSTFVEISGVYQTTA